MLFFVALSMVAKKWAMFGESISTFDVTKELDKNPKKKLFGKGSLIKGERVIMVGKYRIWIYSREYPKLKHQEVKKQTKNNNKHSQFSLLKRFIFLNCFFCSLNNNNNNTRHIILLKIMLFYSSLSSISTT